ncbi:hypothetical protein JRO89_XS04G0192400 [Xanthoceras sorbifolium]|uniref:G protein gamma domain-containing protein n=1 Tax=Xanthoceras sorbifolium TaxID=99658 RepID=A0ABQ8I670_9ROSI|nr:hypothetical protein JRO89_XS04G0192400 [Xanthoceras sorbifolium]
MAVHSGSTSSVPSLPPPCPKSPPEYPDLYGKRRETAKVQMLEREIGFLEEELKSVEGLHPASRYCKEVADFVLANSDPLIPIIEDHVVSGSGCVECPVLISLGFHGFAVAVVLGALFLDNCLAAAIVIYVAVIYAAVIYAALISVDVIYATAIHVPAVLYQSAGVALVRDQTAVGRYHAADVVAFSGFLHAQGALVANGNAPVLNFLNFRRYAFVAVVKRPVAHVIHAVYSSSI